MRLHMTEAEREFRELYGRMRKEYGLWMHSYSSIYERKDDMIEIWEMEDGKKKTVCRVKEKDIEDCYRKAVMDLKHYDWRKKSARATV